MDCIYTISYSPLINSNSVEKIQPSKGIRQGDRYLLIFSFFVLSFLVERQSENLENYIGIQTHINDPKILFLMLTDDCIIFFKATPKACSSIDKVLHEYCAMFGELVNFHKSSIQDRVKRSTFFEVVLKSQKKLEAWKARFLSRAGKITLIETNLSSSPLHMMNCFKLTKRNNEDLDRININFLWQSNMRANGTKTFPLVAWNDINRPKSQGSLGIIKNEEFLLSWRIFTNYDSFWVRIVQDKYIKNNFFRISKKNGNSNVWKEIINHRKYVEADIKWCIGDGRKVCFWTDN